MSGRLAAWIDNWRQRHRTRVSLALHAVGIPLTVAALLLAGWQLVQWRWDLWWRPASLLAAGYVLQWLGHKWEGNDMGELILIKRWLGLPYVDIAPQYRSHQPRAPSKETAT